MSYIVLKSELPFQKISVFSALPLEVFGIIISLNRNYFFSVLKYCYTTQNLRIKVS